jgi:hypothetical protein
LALPPIVFRKATLFWRLPQNCRVFALIIISRSDISTERFRRHPFVPTRSTRGWRLTRRRVRNCAIARALIIPAMAGTQIWNSSE